MSGKEEMGVKDGVALVLRDEKGRVKGTRGLLKLPQLIKADRVIEAANEVLEVDDKLKEEEELQDFILCPNCGFDKFRYLRSNKLHCQKCDHVFDPKAYLKKAR